MHALKQKIKKVTPSIVWKAFRRVLYVSRGVIESIGPAIQSRSYAGITLYFNRGSSIIDRLKKEPIFEEKMCASIVDQLRKEKDNPIFLDIGANIGLISAYILSQVSNIKIYAFEPGPKQRELLNMTIKKNNLSEKVFISSFALSKESGKSSFQTHDPRRIAHDGFITTGRAEAPRTIEVEVTTLDTWWSTNDYPKVSVMKIDTEGAELWILQGGTKMLAGALPTIYLEIDPRNLKVYPHTHLDILNFLHLQQYKLFTLGDIEITTENFGGYIGTEDTYVARPVKRA